jgi:hypothetical protein
MLTAMPAEPEPEDIPDPETPQALLDRLTPDDSGAPPAAVYAHEALLVGFCSRVQAWMQSYHASMMTCMESVLKPVQTCLEHAAAQNEHAQYSLADALAKMQDSGMTVVNDPYRAEVHVTSPQGFQVRVSIAKRDPDELMDGIDGLLTWLHESGYRP